MKALSVVNFVSQLAILAAVYAVAFKVSPALGVLTLVSHFTYEFTDYRLKQNMVAEMTRVREEELQQYIKEIGGGNA